MYTYPTSDLVGVVYIDVRVLPNNLLSKILANDDDSINAASVYQYI